MSRFFLLSLATIFLVGCKPPESPNADQGSKNFNTVTMGCSHPIKWAQDCSNWSGAGRRIKIDDTVLKVAGTADGRTILVMSPKGLSASFVNTFGVLNETINGYSSEAFLLVKTELEKAGLKITSVRAVSSFGKVDGFVVQTSGDGYSLLKAKSV